VPPPSHLVFCPPRKKEHAGTKPGDQERGKGEPC
jgi:hypothetical protein